jgi:hypothetical protein
LSVFSVNFVNKLLLFFVFSFRVAFALEVLFAPYKTEARFRVHVAFDVERGSETLRTAEEDTSFGRRMDLADGLEDHVPVWSTEISGGTKTGDGVLFGICVVDHDVCCIICFDLCGEVLKRLS